MVLTLVAGVQENANRLKAYKAMLVVFPRRSRKPKAGDASREELKAVNQHSGPILPIEPETMQQLETAKITDELRVSSPASWCPASAVAQYHILQPCRRSHICYRSPQGGHRVQCRFVMC